MSAGGSDLPTWSRLAETREFIYGLSDRLANATVTGEVNRLIVRGTAVVGSLPIGELLALRSEGHVVSLAVREGSWSFNVRAEGPVKPTIDVSGPSEQAVAQSNVADLSRAVERGDVDAVLALVSSSADLFVQLRNDAVRRGGHWVPQLADLERALSGEAWIGAVSALSAEIPFVVVGDLGETEASLGTFRLCGPAAEGQAVGATAHTNDEEFRRTRSGDGRPSLPSPLAWATPWTQSDEPSQLDRVVRLGNGIARCLVWYWLASRASSGPDGTLTVTISGARVIDLSLRAEEVPDVGTDIALYSWACVGSDPARFEAVEHAASLAVLGANDIATAAGPALRTAKSLYELTRRGAVGEALAARRSARDAAIAAARAAATDARAAATKAIETTVVQLAAGAGIVLAHAGNVIDRHQANLLLWLIAGTAIASFAITELFTLPSAKRSMEAELADLDQYRDTLSVDNIESIRNAETISSARKAIVWTQVLVAVVYLAALLAIFGAGQVLLDTTKPTGP
jgi:hypothetical protein